MSKIQQWRNAVVGTLAGLGLTAQAYCADYSDHPQAKRFIERMVTEHKFDKKMLQDVLAQAEKKQNILDAIARPAERTKPWHEYRNIFLDEKRITLGVEFWNHNAEILAKVAQQYSVDPAIIVAIIGVETRYGNVMGSYRVIDALTTLGFDYPPRAKFFEGQLEQLFLLAREQNQDASSLMGSYAGAMGYGQFIPSSYRHYARDFDGDGFADIWNNKEDAIASVANYFKAHGWQKGRPVVSKVNLSKPIKMEGINSIQAPATPLSVWRDKGVVGDITKAEGDLNATLLEVDQPEGKEYWLGFNNYYVITRYNRSHMYALAVWQLSEAISDARKAISDERMAISETRTKAQ